MWSVFAKRSWLGLGLVGLSWGCVSEQGAPTRAAQRTAQAEAARELILPWGQGPGRVGLLPGVEERRAQGPQSVAVGPRGEVYLLDTFNERVLALTAEGARVVAPAARHAESLAVGPDGTLAAYSQLASEVALVGPDGDARGTVRVPRALSEVQQLSLGASLRVSVTTPLQETFTVGSPAAPLALEAMLAGRQEGGPAAAEGGPRLATVREEGGRAALLVIAPGGKPATARRVTLGEGIAAARLVGATGGLAAVLIERLGPEQGGAITVEREVLVVDVAAGAIARRLPLAAPGLYVPRDEVAFGGRPATLATLHPEAEGLRVSVTRLDLSTGRTP